MIRLILIALFLALYFMVSLPIVLIEWLISRVRPDWRRRPFVFWYVTHGFRVVRWLSGMRLTMIGLDRIPQDEGVVYIGNHQSYFDVVLSYGYAPSYTGFIGKKQFRKIPFLSWLMIYVNCLFLDRDDIRQGMETILKAIDLVKGGISVCIYPEGTRNHHPDELLEFHKGSFKIAQRTDCPIVPVTVVGSRDVFENHMPFVRAVDVVMEYGTPFRFSDLTKEQQKEIHTYTAGLIRDTYDKNKAVLLTAHT